MNALNFCAFGMCVAPKLWISETVSFDQAVGSRNFGEQMPEQREKDSVLIVAPNAVDNGGIDLFSLPAERRISTLNSDRDTNTGMVMAVQPILRNGGQVTLVVGYESGHTAVWVTASAVNERATWKWVQTYSHQSHSQPILSLDVSPDHEFYITCSADAILAKHPIPTDGLLQTPSKIVNTKHAGQQGVQIRSDGKIFATAGWDKKARVYSTKTMKELAVLKWHKEGCYTIVLADVLGQQIVGDMEIEGQRATAALSLEKIRKARLKKAQEMHWLAAGGKDGKISLWDIY
ncbi:MAG: hypothetical protein Q9227_005880 [Pyrenula ochraceoflavens]